ncbi:MAG TPA: hypothetical protein VLA37_12710 [Sphingomonadaceae bacterium]|nr:hypothetical protein [Sphingomonadaceae bacterium]
MFDQYDTQLQELELLAETDRDRQPDPSERRPEGFQLPGPLWRAMFALYAVFIGALALAAGGSGPARFMLVVAALFMLVYFVTATILARLGGADRGTVGPAKPLQTIYGPLSARDTWVQVLLIPAALAIFGISVLIVVSLAGA